MSPNNNIDPEGPGLLNLIFAKQFKWVPNRVFNLIANVNKQLIAYFGQIQLIAIL